MPTARQKMTDTLAELASVGIRHVGIYGAGLHTQRLADVLESSPVKVVAVLDDDPGKSGHLCAGIPIVSPDSARERAIEAVVISSDRYEKQILARCETLTEQGIAVHRLYGETAPLTHYEAGWDEYARYWSPEAEKLAWDKRTRAWIRDPDQSDKVYPGDEWTHADWSVAKLIQPILPPEPVVLEIGCGSGRITQRVLPLCRELHAVDVSSEMIEALQRRIGQAPSLHLWKVDDVDLSMFGDNTFDAAYSIGVFVHLRMEDIYRYLRDLRRVLKPGGRFVTEPLCVVRDEIQWSRLLKKVADFDAGLRDDPRCFHFLSLDTLNKFCTHLGWQLDVGTAGSLCFRSGKT